jgi:small-conductance mechanosensitive channel/CRP-like cAMP-binding protein
MAPSSEWLRADLSNGEAAAVGVAVALLVVSRALLPQQERRLTRQPTILLVLHVVLAAIVRIWDSDSDPHRALRVASFAFLLAALGRGAGIFVLDVVLGRRMRRPLPRIIRDLSQAVVYLLLALPALHAAGIELTTLLTTSAVLTAVIGLSLQETLGNLFAGLAIQLQHPFDVGDWIQFDTDPAHVGRVIEISWRATKILTADDVEVIIPNGVLGKAPISNFSKPKPQSRRAVLVTLPPTVPPRRVQKIIAEAMAGAWGVLDKPAFAVITNEFADSGITYCVRFWTDKFSQREIVDGGVRDRIWYALARVDIPLATPMREVLTRDDSDEAREAAEKARETKRLATLRGVDFLAVLSPEDLARVAAAARTRLYAPDETILRKGDVTTELFVIKSGSVKVMLDTIELARIEAGQFFGEMALLTGEPRNADVVAAEDSEVLAIKSADVKPVLASHPELAETMSRALAERQASLEQHSGRTQASVQQDVAERTSQILGRVRRFFSL